MNNINNLNKDSKKEPMRESQKETKPEKYVYANILGVWVFEDNNGNYEVVDKALFKDEQISEKHEQLEKGEILEEEKKFVQQYKQDNAELVKKNIPKKILSYFRNRKLLQEIKEKNMMILKKIISKAIKKDILLIQAINQIEELDKITNNIAKRLREWYGFYNPEFERAMESHEKFAELILKKSKEELLEEMGVKESMGIDIGPEDIKAIRRIAQQIIELFALKEEQKKYVEELMSKECPNILEICGPMIGAKLIAIAGGLERLTLFPSSTIQLLGAEKALFRHMKTGSRCPKYGIILNHPFVTRAGKMEKAKAARVLADKISIASKIDYFKGEFIGKELRKEIEDKLSHKSNSMKKIRAKQQQ